MAGRQTNRAIAREHDRRRKLVRGSEAKFLPQLAGAVRSIAQ